MKFIGPSVEIWETQNVCCQMFWNPNGIIVDWHFVQQAIVIEKFLKPKQKIGNNLPQHPFLYFFYFFL